MATVNTRPLEIESLTSHALISWRSIVAGLLIAIFTMIGLLGLGLAFGGINMDQETSAKSAGIFTGVWFMASVLVSLFVGSYFAARVSKFRTGRIGSAQGLVIASIFLGFFLYQMVSAIGSLGSLASSMIGSSGNALVSGIQNPAINRTVSSLAEDALGDLNLRTDPTIIAEGVGSRLLQGDSTGAKNYLARQAGITPAEADIKIAQVKTQVDKAVNDAKAATADALKSTGWTLFLLVGLGALASVAGGGLGSVANFRKPLMIGHEEGYPRSAQAY